jgi:hypothetical protein
MPAGRLPLAQCVLYLALAPKSNSVCTAYDRAAATARDMGALQVPMRIRNAPTKLMEELGYGGGYRYPHAFGGNWVPESYQPEGIPKDQSRPYRPGDQGREPDLVGGHARRTGNFHGLAGRTAGGNSGSGEGGGDAPGGGDPAGRVPENSGSAEESGGLREHPE